MDATLLALELAVRGLSAYFRRETKPASDLSPAIFGVARRLGRRRTPGE